MKKKQPNSYFDQHVNQSQEGQKTNINIKEMKSNNRNGGVALTLVRKLSYVSRYFKSN